VRRGGRGAMGEERKGLLGFYVTALSKLDNKREGDSAGDYMSLERRLMKPSTCPIE
jgi:hypothetical protein